ncbi:hypothetical protein GLOTRDRAFT_47697 [Gloeophyllum trabeum ATCC 11539]|uniref:Uncharacterized protein n=1 Tax=Gloeophyllum trabeum (strain ATCC 11539 / FP-39264 / Madison 617) TaxID=670483 RepID=S7PY60_GLOTA|nr:uncharacterized protein GLOTRDRAFT_47697 [Gloeophyllum trabeum ATCC 11539]EPQ52292.1 hypothetical protein GLOTRDRAFT_47697 [Gloeophyllum trabeum ATCC 11539]
MASNAPHAVDVQPLLKTMQKVYGPFPDGPAVKSWIPPPAVGGHRGRYLWTDGFGVVNLLTLSKITSDATYLTLAARLIETVHDILGRTREDRARLPGATDAEPLKGGLRIGKVEESGPDGDGQYFHYLTVWMFALNRMSVASGERRYNELAVQLARAVHPKFVVNREAARPRMFWKMSVDLAQPLVRSEGNLDPIDGYVVYSLLQKTAGTPVLRGEIEDYRKILETKWRGYGSSDPLDLGMTLWTSHWCVDEPGEEWARGITESAFGDLRDVSESGYFDVPLRMRLAFREFGTCLGIRCHSADASLESLAQKIATTWEKTVQEEEEQDDLTPITCVMYVSAVVPGGKRGRQSEPFGCGCN